MTEMRKTEKNFGVLVAAILLTASAGWGQKGVRLGDLYPLIGTSGKPLAGGLVSICYQPVTSASGVFPCTPAVPLFTDSTLTVSTPNPVTASSLGNWYTYLAPPQAPLTLCFSTPSVPTYCLPDQQVPSSTAGMVFYVSQFSGGSNCTQVGLQAAQAAQALFPGGTISLEGCAGAVPITSPPLTIAQYTILRSNDTWRYILPTGLSGTLPPNWFNCAAATTVPCVLLNGQGIELRDIAIQGPSNAVGPIQPPNITANSPSTYFCNGTVALNAISCAGATSGGGPVATSFFFRETYTGYQYSPSLWGETNVTTGGNGSDSSVEISVGAGTYTSGNCVTALSPPMPSGQVPTGWNLYRNTGDQYSQVLFNTTQYITGGAGTATISVPLTNGLYIGEAVSFNAGATQSVVSFIPNTSITFSSATSGSATRASWNAPTPIGTNILICDTATNRGGMPNGNTTYVPVIADVGSSTYRDLMLWTTNLTGAGGTPPTTTSGGAGILQINGGGNLHACQIDGFSVGFLIGNHGGNQPQVDDNCYFNTNAYDVLALGNAAGHIENSGFSFPSTNCTGCAHLWIKSGTSWVVNHNYTESDGIAISTLLVGDSSINQSPSTITFSNNYLQCNAQSYGPSPVVLQSLGSQGLSALGSSVDLIANTFNNCAKQWLIDNQANSSGSQITIRGNKATTAFNATGCNGGQCGWLTDGGSSTNAQVGIIYSDVCPDNTTLTLCTPNFAALNVGGSAVGLISLPNNFGIVAGGGTLAIPDNAVLMFQLTTAYNVNFTKIFASIASGSGSGDIGIYTQSGTTCTLLSDASGAPVSFLGTTNATANPSAAIPGGSVYWLAVTAASAGYTSLVIHGSAGIPTNGYSATWAPAGWTPGTGVLPASGTCPTAGVTFGGFEPSIVVQE